MNYDLVILGGRVIDPETGLDKISNVGIRDGRIAIVTDGPIAGAQSIAANDKVVAPGWIDLHSHAQSIAGSRVQARDGVTTALDLEAGMTEISEVVRADERDGRAINFGYSSSWQQARMIHVGGLTAKRSFSSVFEEYGNPRWKMEASSRALSEMRDRLERDLSEGAIGIGILIGYAPGVDPREYVMTSAIAAASGAATFTHARDLVEHTPLVRVDGAEEVVRVAREIGVQAHYCHVHSTSLWSLERVLTLISSTEARVSTEAYPYGASATPISADFLAPERIHERGLVPSSIIFTPTGEPVRDLAHLAQLRRDDPGAIAVLHYLDESDPTHQGLIDRAMEFPGNVVASDAMPVSWPDETLDPYAWPPPPRTLVHPRTAGTFSRFFRRHYRELGRFSLADAIARCSLGPAQILESFVPAMKRKGRVQVAADADLVVFDPEVVSDRSTYEDGTIPSVGYSAVVVGGTVVVADDELDLSALPGRAVLSGRATV